MIKSVKLTAQVTLEQADEPVEARLELRPGYPMYREAGELAFLEEQLGLSVSSMDGECLKICLGDLFSSECFESLLLELLARLRAMKE